MQLLPILVKPYLNEALVLSVDWKHWVILDDVTFPMAKANSFKSPHVLCQRKFFQGKFQGPSMMGPPLWEASHTIPISLGILKIIGVSHHWGSLKIPLIFLRRFPTFNAMTNCRLQGKDPVASPNTPWKFNSSPHENLQEGPKKEAGSSSNPSFFRVFAVKRWGG